MKVTHVQKALSEWDAADSHRCFERLTRVKANDTRMFVVDGEILIDFGGATTVERQDDPLRNPNFCIFRGKFKFVHGYKASMGRGRFEEGTPVVAVKYGVRYAGVVSRTSRHGAYWVQVDRVLEGGKPESEYGRNERERQHGEMYFGVDEVGPVEGGAMPEPETVVSEWDRIIDRDFQEQFRRADDVEF